MDEFDTDQHRKFFADLNVGDENSSERERFMKVLNAIISVPKEQVVEQLEREKTLRRMAMPKKKGASKKH